MPTTRAEGDGTVRREPHAGVRTRTTAGDLTAAVAEETADPQVRRAATAAVQRQRVCAEGPHGQRRPAGEGPRGQPTGGTSPERTRRTVTSGDVDDRGPDVRVSANGTAFSDDATVRDVAVTTTLRGRPRTAPYHLQATVERRGGELSQERMPIEECGDAVAVAAVNRHRGDPAVCAAVADAMLSHARIRDAGDDLLSAVVAAGWFPRALLTGDTAPRVDIARAVAASPRGDDALDHAATALARTDEPPSPQLRPLAPQIVTWLPLRRDDGRPLGRAATRVLAWWLVDTGADADEVAALLALAGRDDVPASSWEELRDTAAAVVANPAAAPPHNEPQPRNAEEASR